MFVPDPLQQVFGRDHGPVGGQQNLQDPELLAGQAQEMAAPGRLPAGRVQAQVIALQHRRQGIAAPPGQRPQPGHQLAERERLAQVVVGAQGQSVDPVVDRARGGQHQDPGRGGLAGQDAATWSPWTPGRSRSSTTTS